jgi:hypothetical protein
VVAYGLRYQSLASQDRSEVVQDKIAIRIFFKSLQSESIWTQTGVQLDETLTDSVNHGMSVLRSFCFLVDLLSLSSDSRFKTSWEFFGFLLMIVLLELVGGNRCSVVEELGSLDSSKED